MSQAGAEVRSSIDYLVPSSRINRRFWAPGRELNTGVYAPYPVTIRNARLGGPFTLDEHAFCLAQHRTAISDWENQYAPDSAYAAEVAEVAKRLTGADTVIPLGGMMRDSAAPSATVQPPAAEAHVDFTERCAERRAAALYRTAHPAASGASSASACGAPCRRRRRTCRSRCARAARCATTKARTTPRSM